MLRQHVHNAMLGFWFRHFVPLARQVRMHESAKSDRMRALQCRALEAQLWNTLPAFASWPEDAAEALR
jgi:hypothetical protein